MCWSRGVMCVVQQGLGRPAGHDEEHRSYIVPYAPHDVCSSRVAKCRWRRATTVRSSGVSELPPFAL